MQRLVERPELEVVVWPENRNCERKWILENFPGASAVLVMLNDKIDAEVLSAAGPNLKVVSTMSVGYEHVDLDFLAKHQVRLGYTPDVLTEAVADTTLLLALMAGRNAKETMTLVDEGRVCIVHITRTQPPNTSPSL
ncbi:hypothetical protein NM688_g3389 [Phlebia brevispora]|uniref:Uncharacterized protein n=1 Tax=Phlebia brevispora TaxID=194682 RepID=A0ACC1T6B3_9APHY|nr:hypothetical protein NM688_g3389 [Phlebia brevispora]